MTIYNRPDIIINTSKYKLNNLKKSFSNILAVFQLSIKHHLCTRSIKIIVMNKNACQKYHYHIMFHNKKKESLVRIYNL